MSYMRKEISQQTIDQIVDQVMALSQGPNSDFGAPYSWTQRRTYKSFREHRKDGYVRAHIDGEIRELTEEIAGKQKHTIEVVVDRLIIKEGIEQD